MIQLNQLTTERRNPQTAHIDELDTLAMATLINNEDQTVPLAVASELPQIAAAIDLIADRLRCGGRLIYIGAGTSGRLGILDAVECPPTYGTDPDLVQGLIAGGLPAIFKAQEGAEDNPQLARHDLEKISFTDKDVLVGIAASGRTPYVIGGLSYARERGAATIAVSCSAVSAIAGLADIAITPVTGPEAITGSTRMKAGTAQKLVLNMLSTGTMIKLGKVYGNLMVDVKTSNLKLEERARRIVMEAADCTREDAIAALDAANGNAKLAILLQLTGCTPAEGTSLLAKAQGKLSLALQQKEENTP
ncbi:MAG: N-acetylmuramic acid 6-phosphate etherase [Selenomonas ruminantium]|jgi:N-acetylmuramic acid 6-phosphate etherase|nr:N-acetylmuramic acid 6-phosphate etherase [Selenomonas ruminantium]